MKTYTTGQISAMCHVAPRTVAKWCDSGKLKSHRIPSLGEIGNRRRVRADDLEKFLHANGLPAEGFVRDMTVLLFDCPSLVCERLQALLSDYVVLHTSCLFDAGRIVERERPGTIVTQSTSIVAMLKEFRVLLLNPEDQKTPLENGFTVFQMPCAVERIASAIRKELT